MVLGIILACYLMIIVDISVIITALPDIHRALNFSSSGLSWVQNAYALTFGGLLLLGARAGDILGRRRVFVAGIALFTSASLFAGLAQSPAWLLVARAAQGVGAAIAAPSTLALLTITFREGPERTRAVAWYSAVAGGGASLGLVLGGVLTEWVSWRSGLFINVPIGVALIWLAPRYLPETERKPGRFDLAGAAFSTLGMSAVVHGFVRAASEGWGDRLTIASFVAGAGLIAAFVVTEMRAEQPITPLRLFASRERSGAYAARILVVSGIYAMFFFVTQYLQAVIGFGPLEAGAAFLPLTLLAFAMLQVVPRIAPRLGTARLLSGGLLLALAGMTWLSQIGDGTPYFPQIAVPLLLLGVGMGAALTPLTSAGIAGVAPEDAGAASGLVNTAHQPGGALGISVLVTVFTAAGGGQNADQLADGVASALTSAAVFLALAARGRSRDRAPRSIARRRGGRSPGVIAVPALLDASSTRSRLDLSAPRPRIGEHERSRPAPARPCLRTRRGRRDTIRSGRRRPAGERRRRRPRVGSGRGRRISHEAGWAWDGCSAPHAPCRPRARRRAGAREAAGARDLRRARRRLRRLAQRALGRRAHVDPDSPAPRLSAVGHDVCRARRKAPAPASPVQAPRRLQPRCTLPARRVDVPDPVRVAPQPEPLRGAGL